MVSADDPAAIRRALEALAWHRGRLERAILREPSFRFAIQPVPPPTEDEVVVRMCQAAEEFGVGPMATVAGVLADLMVEAAAGETGGGNVVVENGGEIRAEGPDPVVVRVVAGDNPIGGSLGFRLSEFPVGVGSSSAKISHALSFGEADLVSVVAPTAGLADAAATRLCNEVTGEDVEESVGRALELAASFSQLEGVLVVREDRVGTWGRLPELVRVREDKD